MKVINLLNKQYEPMEQTEILLSLYNAKKEIENQINKSFKEAVLELLGKSEEHKDNRSC